MGKITNPFDIYRLLPKTNCGACTLPNCLAFSAALIKGGKRPADCPHIKPDDLEHLADRIAVRGDFNGARGEDLEVLKSMVRDIDFAKKAALIGARLVSGKLAIRCLGKEFFVDAKAEVTSECHIHPWVTAPLLSYIVHSTGENSTGRWVNFRELRNGPPLNPLFGQRAEKPLKKLFDSNSELLGDLLGIFCGQRAANNLFSSDITLSIHPLPKVPILICYWNPEGEMDSDLNIFFDSSVEKNLGIESIFSLSVGLVMMFEKISYVHSCG